MEPWNSLAGFGLAVAVSMVGGAPMPRIYWALPFVAVALYHSWTTENCFVLDCFGHFCHFG